jgi:ParB/RepB/Spo0J family partition protein
MTTTHADPLIKNVDIKLLMDAPDNPNRMAESEFKALKRFIGEQGFLGAVLVKPAGTTALDAIGAFRIIDGHHRVRAGRELGMEQVPCIVVERDDQQEMLMRIAMNKLRGELDLTGVARAFKELQAAGSDLSAMEITGYSGSEISDLLSAVSQDVAEALDDIPAPGEDFAEIEEDEPDTKVFKLELLFDSRAELKKARAGLKRAGGKTKDMAQGLLKLLGEEKAA